MSLQFMLSIPDRATKTSSHFKFYSNQFSSLVPRKKAICITGWPQWLAGKSQAEQQYDESNVPGETMYVNI